jgi:DNA-binding response OmpR family regulator
MSYRAAVAHRILVIEDDETIAHAVAERLRSEAFVVDVASDGLEGVAHAARLRPDLVALDRYSTTSTGTRCTALLA